MIYTIHLFTHLAIEGRKCHISIRRAVYSCFIDPSFAIDDRDRIVVSKNGDGLDIHPGNLELINRTDRIRRIYERHRMKSIFNITSFRQMGTKASLAVTSLQVSQYNKMGKRIKTYPSIMEASRCTGIGYSAIRNVVHEREPSAGGFYWRSGNEKKFDVKAFLAKRRLGYKEKRGTKVTQYDMKGNPIKHYLTLMDAAKAVNGNPAGINAIFRGLCQTAYGYRWKKGLQKRKLNPLA
ncbi:MAG: hypothetical protein KF746_27020 [Chitinophagaceae bacterium]|nr:hypothetical protein [Chitinophagaceae bacterium]